MSEIVPNGYTKIDYQHVCGEEYQEPNNVEVEE